MIILPEFKPLFSDDYFICDLWGGRAGARSYHLTLHALKHLIHNPTFRGFFLREVHSTIYSSMWQDFKDRITDFQEYHDTDLAFIEISNNKSGENYTHNITTKASIVTKGFKVGSGNQTANLKSLAGATHIYIDESEEIDYSQFTKLRQSLRKKGVNLQIIRAFNPPPKEHWIWKDYDLIPLSKEAVKERIYKLSHFDKSKIDSIVEKNYIELLDAKPKAKGHIAINTNYGHNYQNLNEEAINQYNADMERDFFVYCTSILGLIASGSHRSVYQNWIKISDAQFDEAVGNLLYYLDFGDIVPNAFGVMKIDGEKLYINELITKPDRDVPILIAMERAGISKRIPIIADSANRSQIAAIRLAGYNIVAVNKSHDANVSAIKEIRKLQVYICGDGIWNEYINYRYSENKTGEILKDEVPEKGNDHHMDGIKYGWIGRRAAVGHFDIKHNRVI